MSDKRLWKPVGKSAAPTPDVSRMAVKGGWIYLIVVPGTGATSCFVPDDESPGPPPK